MADRAEFEASFNSAVEAAKALQAQFLRDAEIAKAVGDETLAAQLKFTAAATGGPARAPGVISAENAELTRENILKTRGVQLDLEMLEAIRARISARAEEAAIFERLQIAPSLIVPTARRYTSYEETAGEQSRIEHEREYKAQLAEENALLTKQHALLTGVPRATNVYSSYEQTAGQQSARERALAIEREYQAQLERENALLAEQRALDSAIAERRAQASAYGMAQGQRGAAVSAGASAALMRAPAGMEAEWTAATEAQVRYDAALGNYVGFADRADLATTRLQASTLRLGVAEAEASNQLRRHGALTTEFLGALARGETTVSELGYQVGATIGKFAGWTIAAAATYTALGAVVEFGKGASAAATGAQQLTRTIDGLDSTKAAQALSGLSQAVNVPIKEAADATFLYSRTFHNLGDAVIGAKDALSVFKLDNVSVNDSMQLSTLIFQQFGRNASQQQVQWNMLAAGQREYNARISQTVPLLRNASGAVRASGGDLNQLIQLAILATRVYPGQGGQIGTAFARGAATYTPKNLADLQTRFGLGYGAEATNWTMLLQHAILKSATMSDKDRRALATDIFDPRFGSRLAGIFGPQAAATLRQEIGTGPQAITPARTGGALQDELNKQLKTFHERLHSFVNEMQRFGEAFGASGVLNVFSGLIAAAVKFGGAFRGVLDTFDALPNAAKEAVEGLVALRLAMLFVSRTRFGSSVPLLRNIPGFRPSEETTMRATYAQGNRAVIQQIENDLAATNARLLTSGGEQLATKQRILTTINQAGGVDRLTVAQLEEINGANARIVALGRQQTRLEEERAAQLAALQTAQERQVGLTTINRNKRVDVRALDAEVLASGPTGAAAAAEEEAAAAEADSRAQLSLFGSVEARNVALTADAAAGLAAAEAMTAGAAETEVAAAEVATQTGALTAFRESLTGLAAAMDPMLLGLLALPFVLGVFERATKRVDDATKQAQGALSGPVDSIGDLRKRAQEAAQAAQAHQSQITTSDVPGVGPALHFWGQKFGTEPGYDQVAREQGTANQINALATFRQHAETGFQTASALLVGFGKGDKLVRAEQAKLERTMAGILGASGLPKQQIDRIYGAFVASLRNDYETAVAISAGHAKGKDFLDLLERESSKDIAKSVQGYADRADIYGLGGTNLNKLGETYLFLAARYRGSNDQQGLQLVKQSQQALVSAVNKNVQDLVKASESATTFGGEMGGLNAAAGTIQQMHQRVRQWVALMDAKYKNYPSIIRAVNQAGRQIDAQLNDNLKQVLQQQLGLIKTQADLSASEIGGISPEADIGRAQVVLGGLRAQLAKAQSEHADWKTIADLMTQINNSARDVMKQQIDNARSILDAQLTVQVSSITAVGPAADMERAKAGVNKAQQLLAFDQSHGAGQAKILTDQAAVFDAERSLNEQIQQHNQQLDNDLAAFIQAQAALAQTQTEDPIRQAREQLGADIRVLSTIKPQDFRTYQEYQTAILQQKAKVGQDQRSVRQQIFDQDMANLQFELHTQRITDQEYIDGLYKILKMKHLTLKERQDALSAIFDATHQGAVDLNVGSIKMPTSYEVRAAIARAGHRGQGVENATSTLVQAPTTNHNRIQITVYVDSKRDPHIKKVTDAVSKAVSQVSGQAAAGGITY